MSNYKILFKYASRSRPENFFRGVDNIYINSRNKDNDNFIFKINIRIMKYK